MRVLYTYLLGLVLACGDGEPPDRLELPGDDFFPESITATADGKLYVASITTGRVVRFDGRDATVIVTGDDFVGATGHLVDPATATIYVCAIDLAQLTAIPMSEVRAYDLGTGQRKASYPFPAPGVCNDFARDARGDVYVTDSLGRIYKLSAGALALWSDSPLLAVAGAFGVDGIAIDSRDTMYVNSFTDGRLLRIPILANGTAGEVAEVAVTPRLANPDGMRLAGDDTLIVVDGTGQLVAVALAGATATSRVLDADLVMPTSVAITASSYWITEGQIAILLGLAAGPPSLPFVVQRIAR